MAVGEAETVFLVIRGAIFYEDSTSIEYRYQHIDGHRAAHNEGRIGCSLNANVVVAS